MKRGTREYTVWTVGLIGVTIAALLPVVWLLMLSFKSPATIGDGRFIPSDFSLENYEALFTGGLDSPFLRPLLNSIGIALIATTIAILLASFTAYAIARLDFPGKSLILAGAWRSRCSRRSRSSGRSSTCGARSGSTTRIRPDHPVPDVRAAAGDLHARRVLPEIPFELEQAAQVDGATPTQAFRKVIRRSPRRACSPRRSSCSSSAGTTSCSRSR
jgi:multiple sugar transport system permease protein